MRSLKLSFFLSFTHQALVDTPAATVSFLGALIVVWNPLLEAFVDGRPKSLLV